MKQKLFFHSPLLRAAPVNRTPGRSVVLKRLTIVLAAAACILIFLLLIRGSTLPKKGPAALLYWVHDYLYLPLKGYLYTLFFPHSLIWWGGIFTLFFLWLGAYLSGGSLLRSPHVYLLERAVRSPKKHGALVRSAGWLKKLGIKPQMMAAVVNKELQVARSRLMKQPLNRTDLEVCRTAVRLSQLYIRLICPITNRSLLLETTADWHQVFLQLRVRSRANSADQELAELTEELSTDIGRLLDPLFEYRRDASLWLFTLEKEPGFDLDSSFTLMVDLLYLIAYVDSGTASLLIVPDSGGSRERIEAFICRRLASAVAKRRAILDETRRELEKRQRLENPAVVDVNRFPLLGELPEGETNLPALGRLALSTAIDFAALVDQPDIGIGFLESMEMLDFALNCADDRMVFPVAAGLLHHAPGSGDYRLLAEISHRAVLERREEWRRSALFPRRGSAGKAEEAPVREADFELALSRVDALLKAAGPGFDLPPGAAANDNQK